MPCKSTRTLIHHFSSSPLLSEEKTPRSWTKATPRGQHLKEMHDSRVSFPLICFLFPHVVSCFTSSLFFSFSLDLLPEEIIRTEDMPEYISSDSSLEAEDATPE
jgi:hypothetical protein